MLNSKFNFKDAQIIVIIAFFEDSMFVNSEEYKLIEIPLKIPIEFEIRSFLYVKAKCIITNSYFVGMYEEKAYFVTRIHTREDYFIPEFACISIEQTFQNTELPYDIKDELFYKAFELIKDERR